MIRVDTAYGGDSFVMVDVADVGLEIAPENGAEIARLGVEIVRAANEQIGFSHPTNLDWNHISFCQFAGPLSTDPESGERTMTNAVTIDPGKIDRSPTGTGLSARMAVLRARGQMEVGDRLRMRSIIGSQFDGRIIDDTDIGDTTAIIPTITGRAWITGTSQIMVDPDDPWPTGYRVADTWPTTAG